MSTVETLQAYFRTLNEKGDWSSLLSESVAFTSFTSPIRQVTGRRPTSRRPVASIR